VHEPLPWRLTNSLTGALLASGAVQVDAQGLVTVPDLQFGTTPVVLEIQRAAQADLPFEYGDATAGCAGVADIGYTMAPHVGTGGFDFACTNAPPSGFGIMLLGGLPQQSTFLGLEALVGLTGGYLWFAAHADAVGIELTPLAIPNNPTLVGKVFYAQYAWIDACGPFGLSASRGLAVPILP
jgi:hypothetical protein